MDAPTADTPPCRCATARCGDCTWTGYAIDWPTHRDDYPWHTFTPVTPFCGLPVCASHELELARRAAR